MNFPFRHWLPFRRRFPATVQVANTNFMKAWYSGLRQYTFRNFHCSFLFYGNAHLRVDGQNYRLAAPCAFIIYPRETVDLAVVAPKNGWHQLYYDCEARYVPDMERMRLIHRARRFWPLADPASLWALAEELCALSQSFPLEQVVDRVDRLCERLLIESQTPPHASPGDDLVARVLQKMRREPQQPFNLAETARLSNMSEATFRRRWKAEVGMSPRHQLEKIRMQTACRLLVETDLPVKEVANKVGFEDEFYFSRRFCALISLAPSVYRSQHKR